MYMTKKAMIKWLLGFYRAQTLLDDEVKTYHWYTNTYTNTTDWLNAIEKTLNACSKDQVYNDHYREYAC